MRPKAHSAICFAVAVLLVAVASQAQGDSSWSVSSGTWSTAANWNGGLPTSSVNAYISNGGTATIMSSGAVCENLYLGSPNSASSGTILMLGGSLSATDSEFVGNLGTGTFIQSGGTNYLSNSSDSSGEGLCLGYSSSSNGVYNLSGLGMISATDVGEYVGYSGTGTFTQSGGINSISNENDFDNVGLFTRLQLGFQRQLQPQRLGMLFCRRLEYVGYSGTGTFIQSGGTNNLGDAFTSATTRVPAAATTSAARDRSPPPTSTWAVPARARLPSRAGRTTCQVHGGLYLGYNSGSSGSYNLSGSGVLSAANEYVGYSGTGTLTQSGGTNNVSSAGGLYLGYNLGSSGSYSLSGSGVLSANLEYVGSSGMGTFNQTGGSNSVSFLSIGNLGSYQFSGGTLQVNALANQGVFNAMQSAGLLLVTGSGVVDFSQAPPINSGSMSLSIGPTSLLLLPASFNPTAAFDTYSNQGMTHYAGTTLTISATQGFSGNFSLADPLNCQGTLSAVSGGSINLNGGVTVSGAGNVNLGGGSFIVNGTTSGITSGSLVAYNGYVGYSGTGTFTQSGGSNTVVGSGLYLGYNAGDAGTYTLSGAGLLWATDEYVGNSGTGTFIQSGGTNTCTGLNLGLGSSGSYNLSGAGVLSAYGETVGDFGSATFAQSGGVNILNSYSGLYLGFSLGSSGVYNLSGAGVLTATNASQYVGNSGTGTFIQTGGTNNLTGGYLYLGYGSGSSGSYNLSGSGSAFRNWRHGVRRLLRHWRVYPIGRDEQPCRRLSLPRLQCGFQRHLQSRRLGRAFRRHGERGQLRHGHVYAVGRDEHHGQRAAAWRQRNV